jgi:hypothetical protein
MKTPHWFAFLLLGIVAGGPAEAGHYVQRPPRDVGSRPTAPVPTGSISGRVTGAESGAPLRRAEIVAISPERMDPRSAVTDDDGRFELTGLEAGSWQVTASKTGYASQQFGQRRTFDPAAQVAVAPGQRATADFSLIRASAIGGRVYDEYGDPLAGARVNVLRSRMVQQRRYLQRVGEGDLTDDTGAFRIHGLPPGEYYVTASLRVAPVESVVQTTHAPTYYPGAANFAEAQRVLLAPGADVAVDFPVLPFRTARVSGVVLDSSGAPANAFLNLTSEAGELGVPLGVGGATREDGTFTLPEVPPGTYTLNATLKGGAAFGEETAAIPLSVYGDDVSGLTLVTTKPGTLRGTIVAAEGVTRRLPAELNILARSTRPNAESTFAESSRNAFELAVPVGPFQLEVEPPEGWALRSLLVNDTDVTDLVLDLKGQQGVSIRVVLTDRISEITGTLAGNDTAPAAHVIVFPYDSAKWAAASRYIRAARADDRGRFRITGLPPGTRYLAAAVDGLEEGEGADPEFLARIRDYATAFDLADGEKRVIDLRVIQR